MDAALEIIINIGTLAFVIAIFIVLIVGLFKKL